MTDSPLPQFPSEPLQVVVEARAHGWRIDHYLTRLYPNYSRAQFQRAIQDGSVRLNGLAVQPSRRLRVNDTLSVALPATAEESVAPENIPLDVLYEDDALVVINKAAGMIVHPGRGHYGGTLAAALQFHFNELSDIAGKLRPGIVHRLDRDTTGIILIAKDNQNHHRLSSQFEQRVVRKEYRALTWKPIVGEGDWIETFIRMHPRVREKMQVCEEGGNARDAVTRYEVLERFAHATYVRLLPRTGRTHQLRVHMSHLGHPLLADSLYGGREQATEADLDDRLPKEGSPVLIQRQALHAMRLSFAHPVTGQPMEFEAPLPADMQRTLDFLRSR